MFDTFSSAARGIKETTVKRVHYDSHKQLRRHLQDFIKAHNFGQRLKTLKDLTPYESGEFSHLCSDPINKQQDCSERTGIAAATER